MTAALICETRRWLSTEPLVVTETKTRRNGGHIDGGAFERPHAAAIGEHIIGVTGAGVEMQQFHQAIHEGIALEARSLQPTAFLILDVPSPFAIMESKIFDHHLGSVSYGVRDDQGEQHGW